MDSSQRRAANLEALRTSSDDALCDAILAAVRAEKIKALQIPADVDPISEIEQIYLNSSDSLRRRLRKAVERALAEFERRDPDWYEVLSGLSWVASMTRASDAIPHLVSQTIELQSSLAGDEQPAFTVGQALLNVLAGFAPDIRVEYLFEKLLFDNNVHWKYASTLAVGLCYCDARHFPRAITRFFVQLNRDSQYFHEPTIMEAFFKSIPKFAIESNLPLLTADVRDYVAYWADRLGLRNARDVFRRRTRSGARGKRIQSLPTASFRSSYNVLKRGTRLRALYNTAKRDVAARRDDN